MRLIKTLAATLLACIGATAQAQGLAAACIYAQPEPCLYAPASVHSVGMVDFVLQDPTRNNHPVPIRVYYPKNVPAGLRPVVLWSHGGGIEEPSRPGANMDGSKERHESFAGAGCLSIQIVRRLVDNPGNADLAACVAGGVMLSAATTGTPLQNCKGWLGFHVYGPQNVAFVARVLPQYQVGMLPNFIGTPDPNRMVVGGWSGGTEGSLNIAGVAQQFALYKQPATVVPGVVAFFLDSPRGPEYGGFGSGIKEDAYYGIDARPILYFSGRGDETGGPAESRVAAWIGATPGGKVLSWDNAADAMHGTMDIGDCSNALRANHCRWMRSLGLAFLDAAVMNQPQAVAWLASDAYKALTGAVIELHRR